MADLFGEADGEDEDGYLPAFGAASPRGPGRPKGAANRKTLAMKALYQAKGFRDPLLYLGEMLSKDPLELLVWMRANGSSELTLIEVVELQLKAAAELAPYLHGKMPVRIEVDDARLPVLAIDLGTDMVAERQVLQAGSDGPIRLGLVDETEAGKSRG